ncbi:hypothetical protein CTAYLR_009796 [Chrysophaeum taylorii]|uniref:C2 domain-containing protein n=1 Tax=Chrysophaeum taylorii TaxID=2483200 RepID=A0AAD7XMT2_9STRA|nr:hypothetical protein CTAYLR_009796 [Chrysophaeum taylorii]
MMLGGATTSNPNGDYVVPDSPSDGISSLSFSPNNRYLVSGSWDKCVRCHEVAVQDGGFGGASPQINAQFRAQITHDEPVLCAGFSDDATVLSGGCDGVAKAWRLGDARGTAVGKHDAPIKSIFAVNMMGPLVLTGSWDKTIRFWDPRQLRQVSQLALLDRCYGVDVRDTLMVVATADRKIAIYDLAQVAQGNTQPFRTDESTLRHQTRCVSTFPNRDGFAVGSIEGRVAIHHIKDVARNFAFKCHRDQQDARAGQPATCNIFSVNSIAFHALGTFATAGSDGIYNFWDKDSKQRLMAFKPGGNSISCATFNPAGNLYAYGLSYDWSRGSENYNPQTRNDIMLHYVKKEEIQQRKKHAPTEFVVTLWVDGVSSVRNADVLDKSDPYVEVSVKGPKGWEQTQRSRTRVNSSSPIWVPGERFEFAVDGEASLLIRVMDSDTFTPDDPLAYCVCEAGARGRLELQTLDPRDNKALPGVVRGRVRFDKASDAPAIVEHVVAENQRYVPGRSWGARNLMIGDPGPWVCDQQAGRSLSGVAPEVPEGYKVVSDWGYVTPKERSDGWEYAVHFGASFRDEKSPATFVRRRMWVRRLARAYLVDDDIII